MARPTLRATAIFIGGPAVLALLLLLHIAQGQAGLSFETVIAAIFQPTEALEHQIVRHLRLPRAVIGVLAGGALAVAGLLLQTITRNPLASASTLGINAGAYLAVVAAQVFLPGVLGQSPAFVAFTGGALAALMAYGVAGSIQATPVRLALAGVAVSLATGAVTGTLQLLYENETAGLFLWGSGTLIQNDWGGVLYALPRLAAGLLLALSLARALDVLQLGDDVATSLGQKVVWVRSLGLFAGVWLAAVTVSVVGPIGFVGLVVPHLIRLTGFRGHLTLITGSLIWGAVILVGADVGARLVRSTVTELPAGAVTALIGSPWLLWLARRANTGGGGSPGTASGGARVRVRMASPLSFGMVILLGAALLVAAMTAGLALGGLALPLDEVWAALKGEGSDLARHVVITLRLPRILVAALSGTALAVSGLLLQGVVRNPLADPSIIGVTGGAGLGALLMLVVWPAMPVHAVPLAAFAGAVGAFLLVFFIARKGGLHPIRMALVGVAVSAFCAAGIQLILVQANVRVAVALAWLSGSTYARGWQELAGLIVWPILLLPLAWMAARRLDVLALGDDVAGGLGLPVEGARLQITAVAVALAAAAVATIGTVGFVGLLAPHAARLLVGPRHHRLLPLTALLGALLLTAADLIGRVALAPREVPSGLVVALIGAPYFLWLMRQGRTAR